MVKVGATLKQPCETAKDLKTSLGVASVCTYSVGKMLKKQALYKKVSTEKTVANIRVEV